jgi:hypothetical protein
VGRRLDGSGLAFRENAPIQAQKRLPVKCEDGSGKANRPYSDHSAAKKACKAWPTPATTPLDSVDAAVVAPTHKPANVNP